MYKHYTNDINIIKDKLKSYEEVFDINEISIGDHIYYMTLLGEDELFNKDGGYFENIGNEKIILSNNCGYNWSVNNYQNDKKGNIIYRSRFFIKKNNPPANLDYNINELLSIIDSQQKVIDKLAKELYILKK